MDKQPVIVLLGESLLMDGVAVSLKERPPLGVVRMDASGADVGERLRALSPKVIVFELDCARSASLIKLLKESPGAMLLGLDLDCSQAIVLNSSRHLTPTMKAFCQLIQSQAGCEV